MNGIKPNVTPTEPNRHGFTLVEMLVVIAITGIMMGMLFPAVQSIRESARQTSCKSQIRQLAMAAQNFSNSFRALPRGDDGNGGSAIIQMAGVLDESYFAQRYAEDLDAGETWRERFVELADEEPPLYLYCPTAPEEDRLANVPDTGRYTLHYYPIAGPLGGAASTNGTFVHRYDELDPVPAGGKVSLEGVYSPGRRGTFSSRRLNMVGIGDGATNTLAIGEISRSSAADGSYEPEKAGWTFGATYDADDRVENLYGAKSFELQINKDDSVITSLNTMVFSSNHRGGAMFAFADANCRFIDQTISSDVLKNLMSIGGGEIPEFEF